MATDTSRPDKVELCLETLTLGYVGFMVINTSDSKQNPILAMIEASITRDRLNHEYSDYIGLSEKSHLWVLQLIQMHFSTVCTQMGQIYLDSI